MGKEYLRDGRAPIPENEIISKVMSAIKGKNTKPELYLRKALWQCGIKGYRLHLKGVPGKPDVAFPGKKIAIFVNGCFWHRCPYCAPSSPKTHTEFWKLKFTRNQERDKQKTAALEAMGWQVITIWECQIKNDLDLCIDMIKRELMSHCISRRK